VAGPPVSSGQLAAADGPRSLPAAQRLAALTGRADGPPLDPPQGLVGALDALVRAIARCSASCGHEVTLDWGSLVCGRADLLGLTRQGRRSANGSCRLLRATDGWVAINLPRPDDLASVGALLGEACDDPWVALERAVPSLASADLAARGRLLGMPVASLPAGGADRPDLALAEACRTSDVRRCWGTERRWQAAGPRPCEELRVLDCSAMWAGPLAAAILSSCGASVVKVESERRPDAARQMAAFYRWLHPDGQEEVRLDLGQDEGRAALRGLVEQADVVIEGSRPRAFEQLGVGPLQVAPRAGRVWLSITGYGRRSPGREWVAFGDDAAVAGGLVGWERDEPVFCGDAMADPVTGMVGALAVLEALAVGGGILVDVAMADAAASVATDTLGVS
jgi:CoA-transferase family III